MEEAITIFSRVQEEQMFCQRAKASADALVQHAIQLAYAAERDCYNSDFQMGRLYCVLRENGFTMPEAFPNRVRSAIRIDQST